MKEFVNKVAVVTGAASGIGRAIAERCVREGMKVVLAGINEANLTRTAHEITADPSSVLTVPTDVSKVGDIETLAQKTLTTFGGVHLLINNAGVVAGGTIWESTLADWQWVMGVNLWGVIHGLRVFVPLMLAQDTECHIVNNSSAAGLLPFHPSAAYQVTKHAVVALSEQLYFSLAERQAKVRASVLCTGFVKTRIMDAERNRPPELMNEPDVPMISQWQAAIPDFSQAVEAGMPTQQVADEVFRAIRLEQFYILTHPEYNAAIQQRVENMVQGRNPS